MTSVLIKRTSKKRKYTTIKKTKKSYAFKPNMHYENHEIEKITIFNPTMIDKIISKKINNQFKRIAAITYDIIASDDADDNASSDIAIALDEISRFKANTLDKYQKFMRKEKIKLYEKKILILEEQLQTKLIYARQFMNEFEEVKGKGR